MQKDERAKGELGADLEVGKRVDDLRSSITI